VDAQQTVNPPRDEVNRPSAEASGKDPEMPSTALRVFWPAALIVLAFVLFATVFKGTAQDTISTIQDKIVGGLGWYYTALVSAFVVFVLWVGLDSAVSSSARTMPRPSSARAPGWRCCSPPAWASAWSSGASPSR
jgi:hypothetical protein